jgi:hypothetical protein
VGVLALQFPISDSSLPRISHPQVGARQHTGRLNHLVPSIGPLPAALQYQMIALRRHYCFRATFLDAMLEDVDLRGSPEDFLEGVAEAG